MATIRKKLVIVGDDDVANNCLFVTFAQDKFPEAHVPRVSENYVADIYVDGKNLELSLWSTAGMQDHDRLRPLSCPDTDVVLICHAVDSPDSLENVAEKVRNPP